MLEDYSTMRKLLFVTPNLSTGGTNSSLSNIYSYIQDKFNVKVFAMSHHGNANILFKENLLPEIRFLSLWNCVFDELDSIYDKCIAFLLKILKRLLIICHIDIEPLIYRAAIRKLDIKQYDVVISFQEGAASRFVSLCKIHPKIAWVHCDYSNWHPIITEKEYEVYNSYEQIICVSQYAANSFNKQLNIQHKAICINNIVDTITIKKQANFPIDDNRWDNNHYCIISVGRINPVKHFSEIPEIASKLYRQGCDFRWYIIGPAFSQDEMDRINTNIILYNMQNQVIYLGAKTNPYPYISKADLLVCLSESESCPMIFNEAKCFGTPIVSTNFGSSFEFISNDNEGRIVSREGLYDSIKEFIEFGKQKKTPYADIDKYNKKIEAQLIRLFNYDKR